ncbi:MAG: amylo-alpha-1,6-glucosidase [Candidatus Woesearchaeota archaeon]
MLVTHKFKEKEISKEGSSSFLLISKTGSYISLAAEPDKHNISMYQGLFFPIITKNNDWDMYKTVENISIEKDCTEVINDFIGITRKYKATEEKFIMLNHALFYELKYYDGYANFELDMRPVHDFETLGRIYRIFKEDDILFVEYIKYEDENLKNEKYKKYIAVKGVREYEIIDKWELRNYEYDKQRNSKSDFFIYKGFKIKCNGFLKLIISFSDNKIKAKNRAEFCYTHLDSLQNEKEKKIRNIITINKTNQRYWALACALNSLNQLNVKIQYDQKNIHGIYAGLPWFYQFWARDELISCIGLILSEKFDDVKLLLLKYLDLIDSVGRIPNRVPGSDLGSADGIGWLFKRIYDFIKILEARGILDKYFKENELRYIQQKLENTIFGIKNNYQKDGLIYNTHKETWMDTDYGNDTREGYRIEIQALYLGMLKCFNFLNKKLRITTNISYKKEEKKIRKLVHDKFYINNYLNDGLNDNTIRPNVFLACYIYPNLLSRKEWESTFKKALQSLWLGWGGLASIDKKHRLFCNNYSGLTNESYHRGDSWFFINHIAGISMRNINNKMFKEYIEKIIQASSQEILWKGFIGHNSEVSSASELKSEGCLCQAWSAATFIELIKQTE